MKLKSDTQLAAEFCMNAAGQKVRQRPATPEKDERRRSAMLILEEAMETIAALGCELRDFSNNPITALGRDITIEVRDDDCFDLLEAIDGGCDLNVVVACMLSMIGVPDGPHMRIVNLANAAKFPGGVMVPHPTVPGKYGKPDGWLPPNHAAVLNQMARGEFDEDCVL